MQKLVALPLYFTHSIKLPFRFTIRKGMEWNHFSLLRTFGLNATSTYDSYLPLIFGKLALIWGQFQNIFSEPFLRALRSLRSNNLEIQNDENSKWKRITFLPIPSASSKILWPCSNYFDSVQYLLNTFKFFLSYFKS